MEKSNKNLYKLIIFVCVGLYIAMMILKNVFVAEIISIIEYFGETKSQISIANTYYFVVYALVQFILAFLMSKLNPKYYLLVTVPISVVVYLCIVTVVSEVKVLWYLFAINGFAQAGICAMMKLYMGRFLPTDILTVANKIFSAGMSIAIIVAYGFCSIAVKFFSWKLPFIVFSILFLAMLILFFIVISIAEKRLPAIDKKSNIDNDTETGFVCLPTKKNKIVYYVIAVLTAFFYNTMIYGVSNWLTLYFKENFGFDESYSIIITLVLSLFGCVGSVLGISFTQKKNDYVIKALLFFSMTTFISFLMIFLCKINFVLSIILLMFFELFLYIGLGSIANVVYNMRKEVNVGTYSALTNVAASLAAGFTPTFMATIIDDLGWNYQYVFITIFGVVVILLIILSLYLIKKQNQKYKKLLKK